MAAAITPERSEICPKTRSHAGCEAFRQFVAIARVLCGQPMSHAAEFFRRTGWWLFRHRRCVLADLDGWKRTGGEVSTR